MIKNWAKQLWAHRYLRWFGIFFLLLLSTLPAIWYVMLRMPGESFVGKVPDLDTLQTSLRQKLESDVTHLSVTIGERNLDHYPALQKAGEFVERELKEVGYAVEKQTFRVRDLECVNLEATLKGTTKPNEIIVVVAHYDSARNTPGANDNASGTAGLLALARHFAGKKPAKSIRLVAVTNEEPPYFQHETMGSLVYARRCRKNNDNLTAIISLETIGYFLQKPGSQKYPAPFGAFYPSTGNFIGVVGNVSSRDLVHQVIDSFRRHATFPSEGGALPEGIDGVGWSDHWSFWQEGYRAVMFTDTAPFRYPYYHKPQDTPDKLDFASMALVVDGVIQVVAELAECPEN